MGDDSLNVCAGKYITDGLCCVERPIVRRFILLSSLVSRLTCDDHSCQSFAARNIRNAENSYLMSAFTVKENLRENLVKVI